MPGKNIYLTFDDGPGEPHTSEILECLSRYQAKATFFVCGKNVQRDPEIFKKVFAAGHAIGNHAYSHSWLQMFGPDLYYEFKLTEKIISAAIGVKPKLLRAPWGKMRGSVKHKLLAEGYRIVNWDVAAYDWWQPPVSYIARSVIRQAFDGCVVLLHDGQKTQNGKNRKNTVAALSILIPELQKQGYEFITL
jgi:peptidoglycan/xylan/chitin deacetylase (PgdA/CDA1 family)